MKRILELSDKDIGEEPKTDADYRPRTAARAIVFRGDKIALLNVTKRKYHKLPGGGVETDESIKEALNREIEEEVGCSIKIKGEVGEIIEHRSHVGLVHTSHCFLAEFVEDLGGPKFTEKEKSLGFEVVWVTVQEAIELIKKAKPKNYSGKFIVLRDLKFLESV